MKYLVKMNDEKSNEYMEKEVEALNVFDAIDIVANLIPNPSATMLISAEPI